MKLTPSQQRLLLNLQKRKERERLGLCIVEGEKFVHDVKEFVEFSFTDRDTPIFREIITTENPQRSAAVARIPKWTMEDVLARPTVLVLDAVQDPGNVGTLLRLALGFDAGIMLVESAEVSNPKTVRASAGALFYVPWVTVGREEIEDVLQDAERPLYRLELKKGAISPEQLPEGRLVLVVGSEGKGIRIGVRGTSVAVRHHPRLESLNVAVATGIVLHARYHA
ncbi:RNA methyltransferase [bacterium]|nr:RNA methyltransferase [bacterium]NBX49753.1 RNA methyltransferase [bacterium]